MDHPKELTHISLCAGYGGIDIGLRSALGAVRTVAFSEIEAYAAENLVTKIEAGLLDPAPIWTDLKTFPWGAFRGAVDILSGGFPCQPFSAAGQRRGDDDPRHLWPHIVRGIRELGHPPLVFFENVEGIISSKLTGTEWSDPAGTSVLLHVLRELERLGYRATAGVFSAREVGLPHQRKRVFILGVRCDLTHDQREWVSSLLRPRCHNVENARDERTPSAGKPRVSCAYGSEREGELETEHAGVPRIDTRGAESVGDPQHNGHPAPPLRRSDDKEPSQWRAQEKDSEREPKGAGSAISMLPHTRPAPPAPRGADQYGWEPPRVTREQVGDANNEGLQGTLPTSEPREEPSQPTTRPSTRGDVQRQTEPTLGGDADGFASRMDYEELCHSVDNRTDELRLLGNGVVPATAERAFRVLWTRVAHPSCESAR